MNSFAHDRLARTSHEGYVAPSPEVSRTPRPGNIIPQVVLVKARTSWQILYCSIQICHGGWSKYLDQGYSGNADVLIWTKSNPSILLGIDYFAIVCDPQELQFVLTNGSSFSPRQIRIEYVGALSLRM